MYLYLYSFIRVRTCHLLTRLINVCLCLCLCVRVTCVHEEADVHILCLSKMLFICILFAFLRQTFLLNLKLSIVFLILFEQHIWHLPLHVSSVYRLSNVFDLLCWSVHIKGPGDKSQQSYSSFVLCFLLWFCNSQTVVFFNSSNFEHCLLYCGSKFSSISSFHIATMNFLMKGQSNEWYHLLTWMQRASNDVTMSNNCFIYFVYFHIFAKLDKYFTNTKIAPFTCFSLFWRIYVQIRTPSMAL